MRRNKGWDVTVRRDLPLECTLVNLVEGVVQRLAVAERLVNWSVETVQYSQLELIGALEEVFQIRERQNNIGDTRTRLHRQTTAPRIIDLPPFHVRRWEDVIQELGTLLEQSVVRHRSTRHVQELAGSCHPYVEKASLILEPPFVPSLISNRRSGQYVPDARATPFLRWESVLH